MGMNEKIAILCIMSVLMFGCGGTKIKEEVQESYVKILSCPAPPEINRPSLPIHYMTKEQKNDPGEIAKYYKATIQILLGYSKKQEAGYDKYRMIHERYKKAEEEIKENNSTE